MILRPYQSQLGSDVRAAWQSGAANVCAVLPTGGGKTAVFGDALRAHDGAAVAIAHRQELVGQMSLTLAAMGIRHRIIAPNDVIRWIVRRQVSRLGKSWYDPNALVGVAGVHTLIKRDLGDWGRRITLWVLDEAHHLLSDNLWGKAISALPPSRGLGVTATPMRSEGKGLGRHADGLFDALVVGPTGRELMGMGYLCDYRVFAPRTDFKVEDLPISDSTGEFVQTAVKLASERSHITGDIVQHYLKIAPGKRGITFMASVSEAEKTAAAYRAAGVPAEAVSADTPDEVRYAITDRLADGRLLQLVNVGLFGEGFDVPGVEVVCDGSPTASYLVFAQRIGRMLRPAEGKPYGIYVDAVRNYERHFKQRGAPDGPQTWTLDRREKRSRGKQEDVEQIRVCAACTGVYERALKACPYCGQTHVPVERALPRQVDGDLFELDRDVLGALRADVARADEIPAIPYGAPAEVRNGILARHRATLRARNTLREQIAWYGGWQESLGRDAAEGYRRFFLEFGTDVLTCQTLPRAATEELTTRVRAVLDGAGVDQRRVA